MIAIGKWVTGTLNERPARIGRPKGTRRPRWAGMRTSHDCPSEVSFFGGNDSPFHIGSSPHQYCLNGNHPFLQSFRSLTTLRASTGHDSVTLNLIRVNRADWPGCRFVRSWSRISSTPLPNFSMRSTSSMVGL